MTNKKNIEFLSNITIEEWYQIRSNYISTKPPTADVLAKMFKEVYSIILELKLKAWLTKGTLLGVIRENQFIEGDDDIDIHLFEKDFVDHMYELKKKFIEQGYIVRLAEGTNPKMSLFKNGFMVGMVGLKEQGDWLTRPIQKFPKHLFLNEQYVEFCGLRCLIPSPPEKYLEFVYGPNWKIPDKGIGDNYDTYFSLKSFHYCSLKVYYIAARIIRHRIKNKINSLIIGKFT